MKIFVIELISIITQICCKLYWFVIC